VKRKFSFLIAGAVVIGVITSSIGTALFSQAASVEKDQNLNKQVLKPVHATDIKVTRKVPFNPTGSDIKGKPPSPPGQDKKGKETPAATGILGATTTGEKYAIIIGICDYPGTDYDICNSDGDSLHMYKALTTLYGFKPENIRLFKDYGGTTGTSTGFDGGIHYDLPTRDKILSAINSINATSGDEVVFFFSGHGATGIADDGDGERVDEAIVVHNASSTDLDYIWDGELKTAFSRFATNRIVFIFDTCHAGGMNDLAASGRVISMATGENQVAYVYSSDTYYPERMEDVDGDKIKDGEGVFSHYFVNEGMLQGLADVYDHDNDGSLSEPTDVVVEEAFDYANGIIPGIYTRQDPVISDNFENDLLL
jgi:uncharacterized protein YneR